MSNKSVANNKKYEITFGYFNENKDMQMEFPPKNAKKYNGLQEKLNEDSMEIVANNHPINILQLYLPNPTMNW